MNIAFGQYQNINNFESAFSMTEIIAFSGAIVKLCSNVLVHHNSIDSVIALLATGCACGAGSGYLRAFCEHALGEICRRCNLVR